MTETSAMDEQPQPAIASEPLGLEHELDRVAEAGAPAGGWRRTWRRFARQRVALAGLIVLVLISAFAFGAPLISRYVTHTSYSAQYVAASLADPGTRVHVVTVDAQGRPKTEAHTYLLGADELGRDVLTRLAYGGRISLMVAIGSVAFALLLGVTVGLVAGQFGGLLDAVLMRTVDVILSVPNLFTLILISALVNNSPTITNSALYRKDGWMLLPVAIGMVSWTMVARLVRAEVLVIRELDYVAAARVAGVKQSRILFRHILPNATPVILVWATLTVPILILLEASISFLGFGAQIPTPSWGNMMSSGTEYINQTPLLVILPGALVVLTGVAINLVGNGLQTALDPRS
jgi:peptide/nickel transport system permease protein